MLFSVFSRRLPGNALEAPVESPKTAVTAVESNFTDRHGRVFQQIDCLADPMFMNQIGKRKLQKTIDISGKIQAAVKAAMRMVTEAALLL